MTLQARTSRFLTACHQAAELEIDEQYLNSDGMTEIGFIDPEAHRTYRTKRGEPAAEAAARRRL